MIVKYELKGYADQAAPTGENHRPMDASVEDADGDRMLKFKKFLVEDEEMKLLSIVLRTSSMIFGNRL